MSFYSFQDSVVAVGNSFCYYLLRNPCLLRVLLRPSVCMGVPVLRRVCFTLNPIYFYLTLLSPGILINCYHSITLLNYVSCFDFLVFVSFKMRASELHS